MTWSAHAQTVFAVEAAACSGELIQGEADGVVYFDCRGTYQLSGGSITSDKKLLIRASESLELNNVAIVAPAVELWAVGGRVLMNGYGIVTDGDVTITVGPKTGALAVPAQSDVTLSADSTLSVSGPGGDLTLMPPVEMVSSVANAPAVSTAVSAPIVLASSASGPVQQGGGGALSAGAIGFLALLVGVTGWMRRQVDRSVLGQNLM